MVFCTELHHFWSAFENHTTAVKIKNFQTINVFKLTALYPARLLYLNKSAKIQIGVLKIWHLQCTGASDSGSGEWRRQLRVTDWWVVSEILFWRYSGLFIDSAMQSFTAMSINCDTSVANINVIFCKKIHFLVSCSCAVDQRKRQLAACVSSE